MEKVLRIIAAVVLLLLGLASAGACAMGMVLLTPEEAALPNSRTFGMAAALREDGPKISVQDMEVPEGEAAFPLVIGFAEKEGQPVDLATLKLECLKSTAIDLTPRILPYAGKEGVKVESVSLPPGSYRFRVAIGDANGRFSEKEFTVKVSVTY